MTSPTTNTEVLTYIRNHCKQLLGSKFWQIRFLCKVDTGWKSEKLETKYMVLSKFRFFFLSGKTTSKLQVDASFNLLSIGEINAVQDHELLLGLDGRKLHVRLNDSGYSAKDVATHLLHAFKNYFPSCDPLRFMHLEPSSLYALFAVLPRSRPSLSCDGFRRTYASLCDFYKLPFRDEVVWDIEKIYTLHNTSVLRLDDFSHLFPKDLIPVIACLQFMSWFNGISSDTCKLAGEVVDAIITVVKKSQQLNTLILRNCGLKSDFLLLLASALNANQTIPLDVIDLSGNTFDDSKAVSQLASALSNLNIGCRSLILADCGLNAKSVNALCTALQHNQKRANLKTLSSVSFAKNALKSDVGELSHLLSSTALESVDVSGTGVSLEGVLSAMKAGNDRITTLILSGCSFPERKGKDLAVSNSVKDFFANASSLRMVDLSECALPSEVLKFMLLGVVCNQRISSLRLDLSRSFADRQCISVLETCAPNLASVTELVLRDVGLEQDALPLIKALSLMPALRRLDIGGNNFNVLRKQQSKLLVNVMMEVAKLINDEDGSIRELILSDCHFGVNLSVLLNALGVAPILISLDISGNDFGNAGARLLAKALQLNTVLETLSIDKNQISHEGYADILHSLKGNHTLRCIPYPLHDACESMKWSREKTESVLAEIEQLLQRNAGRSSLGGGVLNAEAHSRLMLMNADDEINKAVYSAEHLLAESKWKDSNHDVVQIKTLLEDTEKAKKLLDDMEPIIDRTDFVDDFVDHFLRQYASKFEDTVKQGSAQLADVPASKNISICSDKEFSAALRDSSNLKARAFSTALAPMFAEFRDKLRRHFRGALSSQACYTVEKVNQEILRSLAVASKALDDTQNSPTIHSSGGMSVSSMTAVSSSGGTPKGKRKKFRLFARSTRPKSIIESDGILDNTDETVEEVAQAGTPVDSCGDSVDSESFEVIEKPSITNDDNGDETPRLTHLGKDRPKLPYQRRQRVVVPSEKRPSKDDLDYAAGVDNFFTTSNADERATPSESHAKIRPTANSSSKDQGNEQTPLAPPEAVKRISRIPPNAVPFLSADMLQDRVAKLQQTPRAAPNIPGVALKPPREEPPPVSSPIEVDTSEVSSKNLNTASEVSTLSYGNDKSPKLTSVSPAVATKVVPPSPVSGRKETENDVHPEAHRQVSEVLSTQPKVTPADVTRSVSPLRFSPSVPLLPPSREATPRSHDDNGNASRSVETSKSATASEENNNSSAETQSSASVGARSVLTPLTADTSVAPPPGAKSALTPPPRPPPPPSAKLRDVKLRQADPPVSAEGTEGAVLRNKSVDATAAQAQNVQRKSVMDLTAMFEHSKPPAAARPVPPPRPNKSKVAATPN